MPNATTPPKKWYVFDEEDCFGEFHKLSDAVAVIADMGEFDGVHLVYMTPVQFEAYCKHGDLKVALKL